MAPQFDLLITAGRVYCPATGLNGPGAVAVNGSRIAASGPEVSRDSRLQLDFPHDLLLPGLVDLHAHPDRGRSKYGVDPDVHFLPRGVTTVLSQGDAGAVDWPAYRDGLMGTARTRVRLALNLAAHGEALPGGCFEDLADADVKACVAAARAGGALIWGIAANLSRHSCGQTDPRLIMTRALAAAEQAGKPLLLGLREPEDWPLADQLKLLRPDDVVTYCFRGGGCGVVSGGQIHPAAWEARQRGVRFDVGHGMNSFAFNAAETASSAGFWPDTISTDQYARHVGLLPPHDLPRTLSKLLAAGMPEAAALAAVTATPAAILGLGGEIGTLATGSCADLAVLRFTNPPAPPLRDASGAERAGGCWEPVLTVRAGALIWPAEQLV